MNLLKVYLSGRVTATVMRKFNPDPLPPQEPDYNQQRAQDLIEENGVEGAIELYRDWGLGLSTPANSSKAVRSRRGSGGITSHGKNLVKDSAAWMEQTYGRNRLTFLTLTVPTGIENDVAKHWATILHNFRRKLTYHLQKRNLPLHIVGVTEVQEERLEERGELGLHIHWLLVGRNSRYHHWEFKPEQFREWWRECICECIGECSGTDWRACENVERIKRSAIGYLGKYMSKGVKVVSAIKEQGLGHLLPSAWYTCTQGLKVIYKKNLYVISGVIAEALFDALMGEFSHLLKWSKFVEIEDGKGGKIRVGWYGDLKDSGGRELLRKWGASLRG